MKRLLNFGFVVVALALLVSQPHCVRIHLQTTVRLLRLVWRRRKNLWPSQVSASFRSMSMRTCRWCFRHRRNIRARGANAPCFFGRCTTEP